MKQYLTCPEYEQLKASYISGWKTWNVNSVFSYVHLPDALTLSLHFKEYRDGNFLRDALIDSRQGIRKMRQKCSIRATMPRTTAIPP